jgi:hypothetical protein
VSIGCVSRRVKIFAWLFLASVLSGFAIWWNYASIAWSYPRYRIAARNWTWRHLADPFDWQRIRIAGVFDVNCTRSEESEVQHCISAAVLQHRGFHARGLCCGIDSCGITGLIGAADGRVYSVTLDVWNENVLLERRHCPTPLQVVSEPAFRGRGYVVDCLPKVGLAGEVEVLRDDWTERVKNLQKVKK